jgi:hypothetical protein
VAACAAYSFALFINLYARSWIMPKTVTVTVTKKKWYRSKTIWMNVLTAIAGLATLPLGGAPALAAKVALASAAANLALRAVTTKPISID